VKVVETNGFSGGAAVQMAVSSVTRQVNALEDMLNTQLLNQPAALVSHRRAQILRQSSSYPQDVESANQCVAEQGVPRGLLKVEYASCIWATHIAPIVNDFLAQYPEVRLDLRLSDGLSNLVEEELDVVIRIGNLDRSGANLSSVRLPHVYVLSAAVQRISHSMVYLNIQTS